MTDTIDREAVRAGLAAGDLVLVDALPESCYAARHLPGALNLVADDVAAKAPELLPDQAAAIVTYCSDPACADSGQVAAQLERLGYTNVRKYAAGIEDRVGHGLPTESGQPA
ncbi:rhodanese-like domain-containing protein [Amycolatopsis sp. CA-128772]|uniref:rhodanese-like domain-containing protein n=1 Tax=Amycolatopsis sp. CA-128772 TaxID=2073159 RepID=UPI000CD12BD2|nr:rhodanese-like domain-containing protein [Amycolatopsis sp. CA-128772]